MISICNKHVEGPAKHQTKKNKLFSSGVHRDLWISNQTTSPLDASDDGCNMGPCCLSSTESHLTRVVASTPKEQWRLLDSTASSVHINKPALSLKINILLTVTAQSASQSHNSPPKPTLTHCRVLSCHITRLRSEPADLWITVNMSSGEVPILILLRSDVRWWEGAVMSIGLYSLWQRR